MAARLGSRGASPARRPGARVKRYVPQATVCGSALVGASSNSARRVCSRRASARAASRSHGGMSGRATSGEPMPGRLQALVDRENAHS